MCNCNTPDPAIAAGFTPLSIGPDQVDKHIRFRNLAFDKIEENHRKKQNEPFVPYHIHRAARLVAVLEEITNQIKSTCDAYNTDIGEAASFFLDDSVNIDLLNEAHDLLALWLPEHP